VLITTSFYKSVNNFIPIETNKHEKKKNTILSTCVQAQQNGGRDLALRVEASFCFDFLLLFD
jgi:hypothetical protein